MRSLPRLSLALAVALAVALLGVALLAGEDSSAAPGPVARGSFVDLTWPTSGTATLVRRKDSKLEVRFRRFETHTAPDLYVYVFRGTERESITDGKNLGRLRTTLGDQSYVLPKSFNAEGVLTVVIWCAKCQTENGAAVLRPV